MFSLSPGHDVALKLVLGASGLLASVLLLARLLLPDADRSPGRRAIVHWLPIAIMALAATLLHHPEIAIGIIFGTSIAAISAVAGFIGVTAPLGDVPPPAQRIWPFLPVPALLAFMIGFDGSMGLLEAALLVMQGLLMLLVWPTPPEESHAPLAAAHPRIHFTSDTAWIAAELVLVLYLAVLSARVTTDGMDRLGQDPRYPLGVLAATLVSMLLVIPMISTGSAPALSGQGWVPVTAQAGIILLNLGVLLPAIILIGGLMQWLTRIAQKAPASFPQSISTWMAFPRLAWRIDSLTLLILCMVFVPLADGKLRLDRRLGGWLVFAYCCYLLLAMAHGLRL